MRMLFIPGGVHILFIPEFLNSCMKQLLIIVPGSKPKYLPGFKNLFNRIYKLVGAEITGDAWTHNLKKYFEKKNFSVDVFKWSEGVTQTFSINPAAKRLAKIIDKHQGKVILFGKSMGGVVAETAIHHVADPKKISELIYVGTPHRRPKADVLKSIPIINIFSTADKMEDLANEILYLDHGKEKLTNAKNIRLTGLGHSDFNYNTEFEYKGKKMKMFDFYVRVLTTYI